MLLLHYLVVQLEISRGTRVEHALDTRVSVACMRGYRYFLVPVSVLVVRHGTVQALAGLSDDAIQVAAKPGTKLSTNVLQKFRNYSETSKDANKPADLIFDHRQADNPYMSLYGEEEWEKRIKKSVTFLAYISITDMIEFMVVESQRVMKGTYHMKTIVFFTMMLCP
jgi:hypothetical protein